jgi:hypothetical protein
VLSSLAQHSNKEIPIGCNLWPVWDTTSTEKLYTPNAGVAYINEKFKILVLHTMCLFKDIMCRVQSNDKSTLIRYLIKLIKYLA